MPTTEWPPFSGIGGHFEQLMHNQRTQKKINVTAGQHAEKAYSGYTNSATGPVTAIGWNAEQCIFLEQSDGHDIK